jgi:hypothetical protein
MGILVYHIVKMSTRRKGDMNANGRIRTMTVGRNYPTHTLPLGIDCYTLLHPRTVVIQGCHESYTLIYDPETKKLSCNCEQFKEYRDCEHAQALSAGLWPRLGALKPSESLVTCTCEWCARLYTVLQLAPAKVAVQALAW